MVHVAITPGRLGRVVLNHYKYQRDFALRFQIPRALLSELALVIALVVVATVLGPSWFYKRRSAERRSNTQSSSAIDLRTAGSTGTSIALMLPRLPHLHHSQH